MRRTLLVAAALIAGVPLASAQNTAVIKERQGILESFGKAAKPVGAIMKGEAEFDLAKVQTALTLLQEQGPKLASLFPDDSKTGEDAKVAEAAIKDNATFEAEWPKVVGNCGGCHKKYRKD
jgi:cytochrome c556